MSAGNVDLRGDDFSIGFDKAFTHTDGNFARLNFDASRRVFVAPDWSVFFRLRAQAASRNLDASQKMYFGGPDSASGYPTGAVGGDRGGEVEFAVAHDFAACRGPARCGPQSSIRRRRCMFRFPYIDPQDVNQQFENDLRLQSIGLRFQQTSGAEWSAKLRFAWQPGDNPLADSVAGPSKYPGFPCYLWLI